MLADALPRKFIPGAAKFHWLLALVLNAALLSAAPAPPAPAPPKPPQEKFEWTAWSIPAAPLKAGGDSSIATDADAQSKHPTKDEDGKETVENAALQMRVNRRDIVKGAIPIVTTPVVEWPAIVPGVYRISARLKYSGDAQVIGTPIVLGVAANLADRKESVEQEFQGFDIGEPDVYAEVAFLYEVDPTLSKKLPARKVRHSWHHSDFMAEAYPGFADAAAKPPVNKPPFGIQIQLSLPKTVYSVQTGMPPNSLRSVSVDWIRCERVTPAPGIAVRYVRPLKHWLRPGDEQSFDVAVENFSTEPRTRTLTVMLEHGLGEMQERAKQSITLQPGESKTVKFPWATQSGTPQYGWEVRAEVRETDKVESSARDFFSIHPRAYVVQIAGGNQRRLDPFREKESPANLIEVFGATPGDCAELMPKTDAWVCGMSAIWQSFPVVRATTSYNKAMGVATHMYLFAGGTGNAVMDLYIRRPDWLGGTPNATDQFYNLRAAADEALQKHDFTKGEFEMPKIPHVEVHLNHWFPALMDQITREAVDFTSKTGYEGIRFDVGLFAPKGVVSPLGQKLPYQDGEQMKHAAENFNKFKDALRSKDPNFEFGANMDSWAYLENVGQRGVKPPDPETYPEFVAFARAGGMFMDEGTMGSPLLDHYMNRFEDALWSMVQKREMARRYGGVYQLFSPHRDGAGHFAHDDLYWTTMIIATGCTYVGSFTAAPYCEDSPGEFITRFSEYYRSLNLKPLPNADELVHLDSPSVVWYADASTFEDLGSKRRYVIPMINPPLHERLRRNKSNELPPPIDDPFRVEIKMPEGFHKAHASMLTWEPRVAAVPLETTVAGGKARVMFPGLKLFRTLVMEFEP
jgi:hypothetical protein